MPVRCSLLQVRMHTLYTVLSTLTVQNTYICTYVRTYMYIVICSIIKYLHHSNIQYSPSSASPHTVLTLRYFTTYSTHPQVLHHIQYSPSGTSPHTVLTLRYFTTYSIHPQVLHHIQYSPSSASPHTVLTLRYFTTYSTYPQVLHHIQYSPSGTSPHTVLTLRCFTTYSTHPQVLHHIQYSPSGTSPHTILTLKCFTTYSTHPQVLHHIQYSPSGTSPHTVLTLRYFTTYSTHPQVLHHIQYSPSGTSPHTVLTLRYFTTRVSCAIFSVFSLSLGNLHSLSDNGGPSSTSSPLFGHFSSSLPVVEGTQSSGNRDFNSFSASSSLALNCSSTNCSNSQSDSGEDCLHAGISVLNPIARWNLNCCACCLHIKVHNIQMKGGGWGHTTLVHTYGGGWSHTTLVHIRMWRWVEPHHTGTHTYVEVGGATPHWYTHMEVGGATPHWYTYVYGGGWGHITHKHTDLRCIRISFKTSRQELHCALPHHTALVMQATLDTIEQHVKPTHRDHLRQDKLLPNV